MKVCQLLLALVILIFSPMAIASAVMLTPIEYGHQFILEEYARTGFHSGEWHVDLHPWFVVNSDGGDYGPGYALFDLSSLSEPVSGAHLSLRVNGRSEDPYDWPYPVALYDVQNLDGLYPPAGWQATMTEAEYLESFRSVKEDLMSGDIYGELIVLPYSDGAVIDVTLTASAVAAINAALGGSIAIGLGIGEPVDGNEFPSEASGVSFVDLRLDLKAVPEPCTLLLIGAGLAVIGGIKYEFMRC